MLKEHYSKYSSEYLCERRALGADQSDEAHSAIEGILLERGESLPPRVEKPTLDTHGDDTALQRVRKLVGRVNRFLATPIPQLWGYCLLAAPLALVPSFALLSIATIVLKLVGVSPRFPTHDEMSLSWTFVMVVVSPLVETVVLASLLWILARFIEAPVRLAAVSAILWGLLHATAAPIWFFGTAWSFYVFSSAYLTWRTRSRTHAFIAAAAPHGLVNFAAVALMRAGI